MTWILVLSVILLLATLAGLFVAMAVVIRRDVDDRFRRIRRRLENDAMDIVGPLLTDERRS